MRRDRAYGSILATLAVTALTASLAGPEPATAKGRNCSRSGTVTLAATAAARISRGAGTQSFRLYGCLKALDRAFRLDHNSSTSRRWSFGTIPEDLIVAGGLVGARTWYFAGRFVGVWAHDRRFVGGRTELWVYSLRSGRMAVRQTAYWITPEGRVREGPLLATNGVPVWIAYGGDEGMNSTSLHACMDAGVKAWSRPCADGELSNTPDAYFPLMYLSRNDRPHARSLRVSGTTVRWITDRGAQSVSVAPLGY